MEPTSEPAPPPSLRSRLLSGGAWALSGKVVSGVGAVLTTAMLARLLTPADVGTYFLALSLVTAASMLARAGTEKTVLQLVARSLGQGGASFAVPVVRGVFLVVAVTTAVVVAAMVWGGARWLSLVVFSSPGLADATSLLGLWVIVVTFQVLTAETFRAFQDIRNATLFSGPISRVLLVASFLVVLAAAGRSTLQEVMWITIAAGAASLLVALWLLRSRLAPVGRPASGYLASRDVLRVSWPLLISNVSILVVNQTGVWVTAAFRPEAEVALFAAGANLIRVVGMSTLIVNLVLPPVIGELYAQNDNERLERVIRRTASLAAIPSLVVLLAFVLYGSRILGLVYGEYYQDAAVLLTILSIGQLIATWCGPAGYTLIMTARQSDLMKSALVSCVFSLAGSLALVGPFGASGVAFAVAAGGVLQQLQQLLTVKLRLGIWTHAGFGHLFAEAARYVRARTDRSGQP